MSMFKWGAPTQVPHVLAALSGATVRKLSRLSVQRPDDAVSDLSYRTSPIRDGDLFAYAAGPLLIYLGDGTAIGVNSDDSEWGSVILGMEEDSLDNQKQDNLLFRIAGHFGIDACDPRFSDGEACAVVGRVIRSVIVYRGKAVSRRPNWLRQLAVRLIMETGDELALCAELRDAGSDDFSVRTKSRIPPGYFESLTEVYRREFKV